MLVQLRPFGLNRRRNVNVSVIKNILWTEKSVMEQYVRHL